MTSFEAIAAAVNADPLRLAIVWIDEDGSRRQITAGQLHRSAIARAHALRRLGLTSDDLFLLALEYSVELVPTFLAGAYGAAIPAILSYFTDTTDVRGYAERVCRFATESEARAVVCADEVAGPLTSLLAHTDCRVVTIGQLTEKVEDVPWDPPPSVHGESVALVQFTSGTTGTQKGVQICHRSLVDFVAALSSFVKPTPADVLVSWLPLYHDMGLILGVMLTLLQRITVVQMSPRYWVRAPIELLRLVDEFKGSLCWMPNFAFSLIARRVRDADLVGLDLSSWRLIVNGAEMVREDSVAAFCQRLADCGLRPDAVHGGYGMAEVVLTAAIGQARADWVNGGVLRQRGEAIPDVPHGADSIAVVSNGTPVAGVELAICDDSGARLPERRVGEILLRSPYAFSGYWRRPDLTAAAVSDGWFRSGDLGYLADGQVFICGRKKDLIIVGGNNIHPEDIEAIADRTEGIQPGRAVCFGVSDDELGTERIVVVCELRDPPPAGGTRAIDRTLRRAVLRELDVTVGDLRFAPKGWVIKTSSGKHARAANREKYLAERALE